MRKPVAALLVLSLALIAAAPADAGKRGKKKPSGVAGVVLNATCFGPCIEPPPPEPTYTGQVTVNVNRASDGALVASSTPTDGKFRFRLKRGFYDVSAIPPGPPPCPPGYVCPAEGPEPVVMPCEVGETQRVRVKRHRFTHVELRVRNICIA